MTFIQRKIRVQFQLGKGAFGESGTNTVTCDGLRVHARVQKVNGPGMGEAEIRIHGLTPSLLNQLSSLNEDQAIRRNTVILSAGDDVNGMSIVFQGQIMISQIMLNAAPDVALMVLAHAGGLAAVQIVPPTSYPGTADVAVIMQNLAHLAGLTFENNGVHMQLSTPYFHGSPLDQIRKCAEAGRAVFDYVIDDDKLAIYPIGGSRGTLTPLVSPGTGMIGYPSYSTGVYGVDVTTLFNPLLRLGGRVQVQSDLQVANGTWLVFNLEHLLESESPGGAWMTRFGCSKILKNQ